MFCFVLFFSQGAPPTGMEQAVFDTMKTSLWDHVDKVTFLVVIAVKLAHFQQIYWKSQFFHFILSFWIAALISTAGELWVECTYPPFQDRRLFPILLSVCFCSDRIQILFDLCQDGYFNDGARTFI